MNKLTRSCKNFLIDELYVDMYREVTVEVTTEVVIDTARLTGDYNPAHLDAEYAAGTYFKRPIAHGLWSLGLVSGILGTQMPGPGTLWLSQTVTFTKPVFIGDKITASVTIERVNTERKTADIIVWCRNQEGETVLTGRGIISVPRCRVEWNMEDLKVAAERLCGSESEK